MTFEIRVDFGQITAVLAVLTLFGVGYETFVAWLTRKHYTEGFLSLLVALGTLVTLVGLAILSIPAAILAFACFVGSGLPMIVGSLVRYAQARARLIEEIKRGDHDF